MVEVYLKQPKTDGSGQFTTCRLEADTQEVMDEKVNVYRADGWENASVEEYEAQFANRESLTNGEDPSKVESTPLPEAQQTGEAPASEEPAAPAAEVPSAPEATPEAPAAPAEAPAPEPES